MWGSRDSWGAGGPTPPSDAEARSPAPSSKPQKQALPLPLGSPARPTSLPSLHREEYCSPGISGGSLSPGRGIWLAPKVMFTLQAIDSQSDPAPSMSQACRSLCGQHGLRVTRLGLPGHSVIHRLCDLGPVVALPEPQFPLLVNMDDNSCPLQGLWRGRGMQRASSQAWPRSKVQNVVPQTVRMGRGRVERTDRGPGNSPIHTASPLAPGTGTWMF